MHADERSAKNRPELASGGMGLGTESAMLNQLKKAQGETNERLERVLEAQQETNRLLTQLLAGLTSSRR